MYGILDLNGNEVIPFMYDNIIMKGDIYHVWKGEDSYYVNLDNKRVERTEVIDENSDSVYNWYFRKELNSIAISENGMDKFGITDKNGLQVIPCEYSKIRISESENSFIVKN